MQRQRGGWTGGKQAAASRALLGQQFAEGSSACVTQFAALRSRWSPEQCTRPLSRCQQHRPLVVRASTAVGAVEQSNTVPLSGKVAQEGPGEPGKGVGGEPAVSGAAIRRTFLDFFVARAHAELPSASLVPEDPTVLLTIAGAAQGAAGDYGAEVHPHQ